MIIRFHRNFERQIKKLATNGQVKLKKKLIIFMADEFNPILNNHPLKGKYKGYRSINIAGNLRAVYKRDPNNNCAIFIAIGSHNKLYR